MSTVIEMHYKNLLRNLLIRNRYNVIQLDDRCIVINLDYKGKVNVNGYNELHKNNSVVNYQRAVVNFLLYDVHRDVHYCK